MTEFFKISKKSCFGAILANFCLNVMKNNFFWKKDLCKFLNIPMIYHGTKSLKKVTPHC